MSSTQVLYYHSAAQQPMMMKMPSIEEVLIDSQMSKVSAALDTFVQDGLKQNIVGDIPSVSAKEREKCVQRNFRSCFRGFDLVEVQQILKRFPDLYDLHFCIHSKCPDLSTAIKLSVMINNLLDLASEQRASHEQKVKTKNIIADTAFSLKADASQLVELKKLCRTCLAVIYTVFLPYYNSSSSISDDLALPKKQCH